MTQVAQRLGVRVDILRRASPELYARLSLRRPDRREFQIARTEEKLRKAFKQEPASLTRLAVRLHCNAYKLRMTYPELCADLRHRYIAHQSLERERLDGIYETHVRQTIEEITIAGKYPSGKLVLSFVTKRNPSLTSIFLTKRALKRIRQELPTTVPAIIGHCKSDGTTIS